MFGLDIVDEDSIRPSILKSLGGTYIDGKKVSPKNIDEACGEMDLIFEATGIAKVEFQLMDALGINGVYVLNGIPEGEKPITIMGNELMRQMVLKNQVLIGSVNASIDHFKLAVSDLTEANKKWNSIINKLITQEYRPDSFPGETNHSENEIKTVINWESFT